MSEEKHWEDIQEAAKMLAKSGWSLGEEDNIDDEVNNYESKGKDIGKLVDSKQLSYGDSVSQASKLMRVFLLSYKNKDNTYTIPESLLDHILLQVRIIDKQNRIFNNPSGDQMGESPYRDITGYGMLGENMSDKREN